MTPITAYQMKTKNDKDHSSDSKNDGKNIISGGENSFENNRWLHYYSKDVTKRLKMVPLKNFRIWIKYNISPSRNVSRRERDNDCYRLLETFVQ